MPRSTRGRRKNSKQNSGANIAAGHDRMTASMRRTYLGRPPIPPECVEFKDSYFHENGYYAGGAQGEVTRQQTMPNGEVRRQRIKIKSGSGQRTKKPYKVHRRQAKAKAQAETNRARREHAKKAESRRAVDMIESNRRVRSEA